MSEHTRLKDSIHSWPLNKEGVGVPTHREVKNPCILLLALHICGSSTEYIRCSASRANHPLIDLLLPQLSPHPTACFLVLAEKRKLWNFVSCTTDPHEIHQSSAPFRKPCALVRTAHQTNYHQRPHYFWLVKVSLTYLDVNKRQSGSWNPSSLKIYSS